MMKYITLIAYTKFDDGSEGFYQRCAWIYIWESKSKKVADMINILTKELNRNKQEIFINIQVF